MSIMAKKVLLLDTNVSSYPIKKYLEREGLNVFVAGSNANDYLARLNENYIQIDYADQPELERVIESNQFDYLVPGCNDLSYSMAAAVCSKFGFDGVENTITTNTLNQKSQFRTLAFNIGLSVPTVYTADNIPEGKPIIVKPTDAFSGKGITIVNDASDQSITEAVNRALQYSPSKSFVIEQFVTGQLYSHSAFISSEKILVDFVVEEHCTANQFVVDSSYLVSDFNTTMLANIRSEITKIVSHLRLVDGLLHTQFIVADGQFWIIEVTKRCPGDLYSKLIEYSTGFPYSEFYTRPFINKKISINEEPKLRKKIVRHTISSSTDYFFQSIKFSRPLNLVELVPLTLPGKILKPSPFDRVALMFLDCDGKDIFDSTWQQVLNRTLYFF